MARRVHCLALALNAVLLMPGCPSTQGLSGGGPDLGDAGDGAPTDGAVADGGVGDAGVDEATITVLCGETLCRGTPCCTPAGARALDAGTCTAQCSGALFACDDHSDCNAGEVCCPVLLSTKAWGGSSCTASCASARFCDPDAAVDECASDGKQCRASVYPPLGFSICGG